MIALLLMEFTLQNAERESDSLKAKLQKVLEFIKSLKLTQKLQELFKPRTLGVRKGAFSVYSEIILQN